MFKCFYSVLLGWNWLSVGGGQGTQPSGASALAGNKAGLWLGNSTLVIGTSAGI